MLDDSERQAEVNRIGASMRLPPRPVVTRAPPTVGATPIGCQENGTCYGDISATTGAPKTVEVRGYTRADGTYVRGHYRSK
jgi:hypothetical protein